MLVLIVLSVWTFFPFVLVNVLARLQTIPPELYDAARVDGASAVRQFVHVTLPQLKNVLLIVLLLRGIWMFTKFDVPWLLGFGGGAGEAIRTLPVFTYQRSFTYYQAGMGAALSNVMFALLLMTRDDLLRRVSARGRGERWLSAAAGRRLVGAGRRRGRAGVGDGGLGPAHRPLRLLRVSPLLDAGVLAQGEPRAARLAADLLAPRVGSPRVPQAVLRDELRDVLPEHDRRGGADHGHRLVAGVIGAYSLTRYRFRGRTIVARITLLAYMFPPIIMLVPLFLLARELGLVNSLVGLALTYISFSLPYALWILRAFFQSIPVDLEHAALIDGANRAQALWYVVMPLALPGIIATAIFTFIVAWNDFLFALVLIGKDELKTLAIGINEFFHMAVVDWGLIMAAGVMVTIPAVIFFVAVQRYLIAGWGAGGMKG